MNRRFAVQVSREDPWWVALVEGVPGGWEMRRLEQLEGEVRDGLAVFHDLDPSEVELDWRYELPVQAAAALGAYRAKRAELERAENEYARTQREAAVALAHVPVPVRDVARLMQLSRARAATLLTSLPQKNA